MVAQTLSCDDFADMMARATTSGNSTVITVDAMTKITLQRVALANLDQSDFLFV